MIRNLLGLLLVGCMALGCARGPGNGLSDSEEHLRLQTMAEIFYLRLSSRRVNSIATFQDPGLREFFRSRESFADYFADLVQALTDAHFERNRAEQVEIEGIRVEPSGGVLVRIRFRGANSLPLRWWGVDLVREDHWESGDGRWWIVPGKL